MSDTFQIQMAVAAMGTRFELLLRGESESQLRAAGEATVQEIEYLHERLSVFRNDSVISHINRCAGDGPVRVDSELFALLKTACDVCIDSDGAFDINIGTTMRELGFRQESQPPINRKLDHKAHDVDTGSKSFTSINSFHFDDEQESIQFAHPGVELDLGGIAKGFAIDAAMRILHESGVPAGMIHGGTSTMYAWGSPVDGGKEWKIEIHDPRLPEHAQKRGPVVTLRNTALSVSAPHGRVIQDGTATHTHIIDPRTGESVNRTGFAAVVGPSALLTDAWSTATLVHGERAAATPDSMTSIVPAGAQPHAGYTVIGDHSDAVTLPD